MKVNYKRLFLWSSVGSIAVGAALALARRSGRPAPRPVSCRRIPRDCSGVDLWTERFEIADDGVVGMAHDRYHLQPTAFKVWSVLDLDRRPALETRVRGGADVYHVTQVRVLEGDDEEERLEERFYGIVSVVDSSGLSCGNSQIGRGGILEIRKCYVGGASNGIESGEIHRSRAPVLNYRIEHGSG